MRPVSGLDSADDMRTSQWHTMSSSTSAISASQRSPPRFSKACFSRTSATNATISCTTDSFRI